MSTVLEAFKYRHNLAGVVKILRGEERMRRSTWRFEGRRGSCMVTGTFLLEALISGTIPSRRRSNIVSRVKAG